MTLTATVASVARRGTDRIVEICVNQAAEGMYRSFKVIDNEGHFELDNDLLISIKVGYPDSVEVAS